MFQLHHIYHCKTNQLQQNSNAPVIILLASPTIKLSIGKGSPLFSIWIETIVLKGSVNFTNLGINLKKL